MAAARSAGGVIDELLMFVGYTRAGVGIKKVAYR
jgi:hypothetical protein